MNDLADKIKTQGVVVRDLKADKATDKVVLKAAVDQLLALKKEFDALKLDASKADRKEEEARAGFETLLIRKFIVVPAFEIYGGVRGLFDFGPPGCAILNNWFSIWRSHFVLNENMLEISCTTLTPHDVLKTSGHVDKFSDFMVKDVKTQDCHRADKILEDHIDNFLKDPTVAEDIRKEMLEVRSNADAYSQTQLGEMLKKYDVKAPDTGNDIGEPYPFNLMFGTQIGPTGKLQGYMRPETAQGIFVNFKRLLEYNRGAMPFAAAQIGLAFRNEISPRAGLLRVREFTLAEIEHFVNPEDKSHPKFDEVKEITLNLLSGVKQGTDLEFEEIKVGDAVANKTINNETLAYFMTRTHLFLIKIGIDPKRLRFRQHKSDEMAHYAQDCWDAEFKSSYGWVECVGHADRACYDLKVHSAATKIDLTAQETYDVPKMVEKVRVKPNKGKIGQKYKKEAKSILDYMNDLGNDKAKAIALKEELVKGPATITTCDGSFVIDADMYDVAITTEKESTCTYMPSVIEPSFGVGRIIYGLLEHCYMVREGRAVLALPACIAPIKSAILPISKNKDFDAVIKTIEQSLIGLNISAQTDNANTSIGRKYARADEIGTPFAITIDFQTLEDQTVTIRDRDSTTQIRTSVAESTLVITQMCTGALTWKDVYEKYPHVHRPDAEEGDEKSVVAGTEAAAGTGTGTGMDRDWATTVNNSHSKRGDVPVAVAADANKDSRPVDDKSAIHNKDHKEDAKGKKGKGKGGGDQKPQGKKEQQAPMSAEEKAAAKAAKDEEKAVKAAFKEGGKKGQDLEGMADLGGVKYFHVAMQDCQGRHDLMKQCMAGANVEVDPEGEERKGGAGNLAKCFLSASDTQLVIHIHVPAELAKEKISAKAWYDNIKQHMGEHKVVAETDTTMEIECVADPDKGVFPLKVRDEVINQGFAFLVSKQLVPDQDSSDDECYLPDDW